MLGILFVSLPGHFALVSGHVMPRFMGVVMDLVNYLNLTCQDSKGKTSLETQSVKQLCTTAKVSKRQVIICPCFFLCPDQELWGVGGFVSELNWEHFCV